MQLEILTPEKKVFQGDVFIATFPGVDGSFQVMDHHAPLISLLKNGVVEYKLTQSGASNTPQRVTITGGVVEALNNKVILLADGVTP